MTSVAAKPLQPEVGSRSFDQAGPSAARPNALPSFRAIRDIFDRRASRSANLSAIGLALLALGAMLVYAIPRHEPWADEAQAWELARSLSLNSLFGTYLHYECSPGLWHLLLWVLSRLHVTYAGLHWASAAFALAGMAVLAALSPFPLIVRLALPFTYFFAFQYAVVARSYVLFPLLLFVLAHFWRDRRPRPLPVFLTLGLLANLSAHGLAVAAGLALVLGLEWFKSQRELPRRSWLPATVMFAAMTVFAVWCVFPAPDASWFLAAKQIQVHGRVNMVHAATSSLPWLSQIPFRFAVIIALLSRFEQVLCHGVADKFYLGRMVWSLLILRWWRHGQVRYALPVLALAIPCTFTPFHFYHAGLFWVLLLFLWWITWPEPTEAPKDALPPATYWAEQALLASIVLCIVVQLSWSLSAFKFDAQKTYSPDRDGAAVLETYLRRGDRVDFAVPSPSDGYGHGQFYVVGLEPYFRTEPFGNMDHRFWFWGRDDQMRTRYLLDAQHRSAVIVVEEIVEDERYTIEENRLEALGYRKTKEVCGQVFYPHEVRPRLCHAFYEPGNKTDQRSF